MSSRRDRRKNFTDRWLQTVKPSASGEVEWFDTAKGSPAGFGLRVFASGTKSFAITYRRNGRKRRYALGRYPIVSLQEAREKAKKIDAEKSDPSAERERVREVMSFETTANAFLEEGESSFRPSTHIEYKRIIDKTLVPKFGALRLDQISRAEVKAFLRPIAKKHPHMANRIHAVIRQVFNFAVAEERVAASPIAGMPKPAFAKKREPTRERVLSIEEIEAIWTALDDERPLIASYFRILFLTGCRKRETLDAQWKHIDKAEHLWRIAPHDTKTGQPLEVPLSPSAWQTLEAVRALTGHTPYVFVGVTGKPILNPNKAKLRLVKASGVEFRIHDIRRSVATHLARLGVRSETVSAILGHAIGHSATTRIYERYERLPEKRAALERWATELDRIVAAEDVTGDVVEFPRMTERPDETEDAKLRGDQATKPKKRKSIDCLDEAQWREVSNEEIDSLPPGTVYVGSVGSRHVETHGDVAVTGHEVVQNHEARQRIREQNRQSGRQRRSPLRGDEIRRKAHAYRERHPYSSQHSTRRLAMHIAGALSISAETVRKRLRVLKIQ